MLLFGCACHPGLSRRGVLSATFAAGAVGALPRPSVAQAPGGAARAIDIHAHYFPQAYLDVVGGAAGRAQGSEYRRAPEGWYISAPGNPATAPLPTKFIDLGERLADMDAQGVAVHALSLTSPMVYWADGALGETLSRAFNDACVDAHRQKPDRFVGLAMLPMQDTERSLRELERVKGLPGIRGVYCGTNVNGMDLSAPQLLPVWKAVEAAGLPVFLHPLNTVGGPRMRYYMNNFIGNPVDSAIAAGHLIFGGVLDACPRLEVSLPHAGGVLPILIGRFDHGAPRRPETKHLGRAPSEYLRRFTYDTIAHSPEVMKFVIGLVGADRVVLGSDYCYDMGYEQPVGFVDKLGLNAEERAMVLGGTAARLLKL